MNSLTVTTSNGTFLARYSTYGLCALHFPQINPTTTPLTSGSATVAAWHDLTIAAVTAILDGRAPGELPPFDLPSHTAFRRKVWEELRRIPLGETASYAEIAQRIGQPKATRAVGGACGANPIPLIIPCHRVLAAGHRLGGFSGGLHWKRKLLTLEGVVLSGEPEMRGPKAPVAGLQGAFF